MKHSNVLSWFSRTAPFMLTGAISFMISAKDFYGPNVAYVIDLYERVDINTPVVVM